MKKIKCWIHGHVWLATKWINDNPNDSKHIVYCPTCGKRKIISYE